MNRTMVIAHRGVTRGSAENTIESFVNAIDVGADMVEFDVRRTHDGKMIAFHDSNIDGIELAELSKNQVAAATGAEPALLPDILELCAGKIKLDIELKEDGYIDAVVRTLKDSIDVEQIVITSFIPAVLSQVKTLLPNVRTGLLVGIKSPKPYLRTRFRELYPVGTAKEVRADYIAPHWELARLGVLRRAAAAGIPCFVWTVNSEELIRRFASDSRVAAIITDQAESALRIVDQINDLTSGH